MATATTAAKQKNKRAPQPFKFQTFSVKQKKTLTWWTPKSPYKDYDMIICDGAIRSGKTVSELISFIMWSLTTFEDETFVMAGKTMGALKRNVLNPLFKILSAKGISYRYIRSTDEPRIEIGSNIYYIFGANNEAAQDKIQGLTAAGAYADEIALFPQSFVEQMIGRCSVEGAKVFANCNPLGPKHWFKLEYIDKAKEKRILYLHFVMEDNLTLAENVKERYRRMFTGVFYQRYIRGLWVMAEGIIYDMFDENIHTVNDEGLPPYFKQYWVGVDYGTANPTVFLLIGLGSDGNLYVVDEWRWDSKKEGRQKTDKEYSRDFIGWISSHEARGGLGAVIPKAVFVDPSATSFALQLNRDGVKRVMKAENAVIDGIRAVSSLFGLGRLFVHKERCKELTTEMQNYVWDEKAQERGEDKPLKVNDHGPDALRYSILSIRGVWIKWVKGAKSNTDGIGRGTPQSNSNKAGLLPQNIA